MSDKKVVLYCETVPEGFQQLVCDLCPPEFDLRFLFPKPGFPKGEIEDADYILASIYKINRSVIDRASKVRLIHCPATGVNHIDLDYAREKGIYVCNSAGLNASTTAEMTIALMLCCLRRICLVDRRVKQGEWHSWTWRHDSYELLGKTVGVIGGGAVGREVMKRLAGWGVKIIYSDPYRMSEENEKALNATYVDQDTLLREADVVSLHCPLLPSTRGMIGREQFKMMKKNAIIVNEARGAVIDNDALTEALQNGEIWGAAIDCWEHEPLDPNDPLVKMDKVITTSHLGAVARECAERCFSLAFDNILAMEHSQKLRNIVNGMQQA